MKYLPCDFLIFLLCVFALLVGSSGCTGGRSNQDIERLTWLCGTWHLFDNTSNYYEEWEMSNDHGKINGIAYDLIGSDTVIDELLSVKYSANTVYYTAYAPGNRDSVRFELVSLKPNYAVFENLDNPYPTRIMYAFNEPDFLYARLEGWQENRQKIKEYFLQKVH